MIKNILVGLLMMGISPLCLGQQASSSANGPDSQRVQLTLQQLPGQIKSIDEPAVRILLRLRLATFLWKTKANQGADIAEGITADALSDLQAHDKELPPLYENLFRRDLMALARLYAPHLLTRLDQQDKSEQTKNPDEFGIALSMLDSKEGVAPAVETIYRALKSGQNFDERLIFLLGRLEQLQSPELSKMLVGLIMLEEQKPGTVSVASLSSILRFYLKDETPAELKARYFAVILRAIETSRALLDSEKSDFASQDQLNIVYGLLNNLLPRIETIAPSFYPRARSLLTLITARMPKWVIDRADMRARIRQSPDPLNQLVVEAGATTDESIKESLLTEAAQLALSKGQLRMAADLVPKKADDSNYNLWRDQFLGDIVSGALDKKDTDLASYTVSKMKAPMARAYALRKIGLYFFNSKDTVRAGESLNEAAKMIYPLDNSSDKAIALLSVAGAFAKVDEGRVTEMAHAAIKVINNIPQPGLEHKPDSEARKAYVKSVIDIAYSLIPIFQNLVLKDEIGAFGLANGLLRLEFKAVALYGATTGTLIAGGNADSKTKQ